MPTYNVIDHINQSIGSIMQSPIDNFEIICVDDCSVDGTDRILDELSKEHCQLTVFKLDKNRGQSFCRNFGLSKASGEFIFFFDSDDSLSKENDDLTALMHLLDELPNFIDVVQINNTSQEQAILSTQASETITLGELGPALQFTNVGEFLYIQNKKKTVGFQAWRFVYRREFLRRHALRFNPDMRIWEDALFTSQCLQIATSILCTDLKIYEWRLDRPASLSNKHGVYCQDYFKLITILLGAAEKEPNLEKKLFNAKLIHSCLFELNLICSQINLDHLHSVSNSNVTLKKVSAILEKFALGQFVNITRQSNTFKQLIEKISLHRENIIYELLKKIRPNKQLFLIPASRQNAYLMKELRARHTETKYLLDGDVNLINNIIHEETVKSSTEQFLRSQNNSVYVINFTTKDSQSKYIRYLRNDMGFRCGENFVVIPDQLNGRE